jgi:hypothetical protein
MYFLSLKMKNISVGTGESPNRALLLVGLVLNNNNNAWTFDVLQVTLVPQ